jgi:hypothetical protein
VAASTSAAAVPEAEPESESEAQEASEAVMDSDLVAVPSQMGHSPVL